MPDPTHADATPVVFAVDDDTSFRTSLERLIHSAGYEVRAFASADEFLRCERGDAPACLVLDLSMPGQSGLDLQRELARRGTPLPIIFVSGHADVAACVEAMNAGATEFLTKPFLEQDLFDAIHLAIQRDCARREERDRRAARIGAGRARARIVGPSEALRDVFERVAIVAPTPATVLILGETGTGKELVARAIHDLSARRELRFVKVNCAAIPTGLLESELFGHERGAFTGAISRRIGRFEYAHEGTIFLDEVGEISFDLQAKLLRVLQESEFERIGSSYTTRVDVRVIAATNCELIRKIAAGGFRSDLYYRLNVFPIAMPALREHREDIPFLAMYFVEKYAGQLGKTVRRIPAATMAALCRHAWPGNVRELENFIERSVILSEDEALEAPLAELTAHLPGELGSLALADVEREHIRRVLEACRWVVAGPAGAAATLGMKRTSLQYRMLKLGITRPAGGGR
jgi:DNA-binding NtrC family response regulator